jgi:hypothetical protein
MGHIDYENRHNLSEGDKIILLNRGIDFIESLELEDEKSLIEFLKDNENEIFYVSKVLGNRILLDNGYLVFDFNALPVIQNIEIEQFRDTANIILHKKPKDAVIGFEKEILYNTLIIPYDEDMEFPMVLTIKDSYSNLREIRRMRF